MKRIDITKLKEQEKFKPETTDKASDVNAVVRQTPWKVVSSLPSCSIEEDAWDTYGNYEAWLRKELGEDMEEIYDELDPTLQANLYGVISNLFV